MGFFDRFRVGRSTAVEKASVTLDPSGVTGLKLYSGLVHEEFLPELRGARGVKVYREMRDNSAIVGGVLFAIEMLVRNAEWRVEPASNKPEDVEATNFVESCMNGMENTWEDFLAEVLTMLPFGWAVFEVCWKKRVEDGRYGWRVLEIRAQETLLRWDTDPETGAFTAMVQQCLPDYKPRTVPLDRCLHFRTTAAKNNPEGRSLLRNAYRSWYFGKRIEEIEGIGIERDLAGLPVALVPARIMAASANAQEAAILEQIKSIVRNIRRDEQEGVVFPSDRDPVSGTPLFELKLLSTGGSRQFDTDRIVQRHERHIAMTALADFILLGHEKVGSFALSSDKTDLFGAALGAWLKSIAAVINKSAIEPLLAVNGMEGKCSLVPGDVEKPDLDQLGSYIQKLAASGVPLFPDDDLENFLRRTAGMPERTVPSAELPGNEDGDSAVGADLTTDLGEGA